MTPKNSRHSPSSLNAFASSPAMFIMERLLGFSSPVGAAAYRGTACETGLVSALEYETSDDDAVKLALDEFDKLAALSGDPRLDKVRRQVEPITRQAIKAFSGYGPPSSTQGLIEWKPPELEYPIIGYYDFMWDVAGIVVDLKTRVACPSAILPSHARQVAFYTAGNLAGRVAYVTPKRHEIYELEDIDAHRTALLRMAIACENFCNLSDDAEFYKAIIMPDVDHYFFSDPAARQNAFEVFGV